VFSVTEPWGKAPDGDQIHASLRRGIIIGVSVELTEADTVAANERHKVSEIWSCCGDHSFHTLSRLIAAALMTPPLSPFRPKRNLKWHKL